MNEKSWFAASAFLFLTILLVAAIPVSITYGISLLQPARPETILPTFVVSSLIGLMVVFSFVSAIFSAIGLSDQSKALGLPEGSVRAVIALSLILLFIVSAIFLYWSTRIDIRRYQNLPKTSFDAFYNAIPKDQIVAVTTDTVDNQTVYTIERMVDTSSEDSVRLAQQILTTVSTLVVAVAGFYFGATSVEAARAASGSMAIRLVSPAGPSEKLPPNKGASLSVRIETTPKGLAVRGTVTGDNPNSLVPIGPDEFKYAREEDPAADTVTLTFSLELSPNVSVPLIVTKQ